MAAHPRLVAGIVLAFALASPPAASALDVQRTHGPDRAADRAAAPLARMASASGWCTNDPAQPDSHQVENGDHRYRAVYVHAADAAGRLSALGPGLEADAFDASALIEHEYGRAIRFDIGTPCGPDRLDISQVRLPYTQAQLAALAAAGGTATFDAVAAALRTHGFAVAENDAGVAELAGLRENFLVWLDGPAPARSCGQGTALLDGTRSETNVNNLGGKLALVFRQGRAFCGADVVRHEIGHNLGALQPDAPNTSDGVHCNDAFEDTMCGVEAPKLADGPFNGLYFDHGNDDYWDPPHGPALGWWTLNLSRFICPDADCNRPAGARPSAEAQRPSASDRRRMRPERPRLTRRLSRGDRFTRIRLRARGRGTALLVVRCRRHGRVVHRRVGLPSTVLVRTRCRAPQARLRKWHRPRAAAFGMRK